MLLRSDVSLREVIFDGGCLHTFRRIRTNPLAPSPRELPSEARLRECSTTCQQAEPSRRIRTRLPMRVKDAARYRGCGAYLSPAPGCGTRNTQACSLRIMGRVLAIYPAFPLLETNVEPACIAEDNAPRNLFLSNLKL